MTTKDIRNYLQAKLEIIQHNKTITNNEESLLWYEAQESLLDNILLAIQ